MTAARVLHLIALAELAAVVVLRWADRLDWGPALLCGGLMTVVLIEAGERLRQEDTWTRD